MPGGAELTFQLSRVVGIKADRISLLILLFPFFGLWALFWLVPLILGVDLSMQNPDRNVSYWEDFNFEGGGKEKSLYSWMPNPSVKEQEKSKSRYVGLDNFKKILSDPKFFKALKNTSIYVFGSIIVILPIAFLLSISLYQFNRISRGVMVFCLMIPGLALPGVLSTLFYLFFHGRTGALNQYLVVPLGFDPVNWMMNPIFIMPSLIMQAVWRWTGLITLFFLCGLEAIPRWQFEVAKLEGTGFAQKLGQIFLPNLWHLGLFATVFLVVDGFASFSGAYNLLGGSGGILDAGLLLVTYIYQVAFPGGSGRFDFPAAAAMSILVVPVCAMILFFILQSRRGWFGR